MRNSPGWRLATGDWRRSRSSQLSKPEDDKHMARSPRSGSTCRYAPGKSRNQHSSRPYHYIQAGMVDEMGRSNVPQWQQFAVKHALASPPPRPQ